MKERPILFSDPMVRAILAGRKTQTRRVVKAKHLKWLENHVSHFLDGKWNQRPMPYGKPGDQLWVREAWSSPTTLDPGPTFYRADYPQCVPAYFQNVPSADKIRWKPSIHMKRADSRILLEITGIRVERLQDISDADSEFEGVDFLRHVPDADETLTAKQLYMCLWDSINGAGSWHTNPLVWVIEFKPITGG